MGENPVQTERKLKWEWEEIFSGHFQKEPQRVKAFGLNISCSNLPQEQEAVMLISTEEKEKNPHKHKNF